MTEQKPMPDAAEVASRLAEALEAIGQEYALGGAIALGYWAEPRGTLDVDVTLFMPQDKPSQCVRTLQDIGCELKATEAIDSLREHSFCQVQFETTRVDVFLPSIDFYTDARDRRRRVSLEGRDVWIWDAETLVVFKLMFFRTKDMADIEQILNNQSANLDCDWIQIHVERIYGIRDPRVSQWNELRKKAGL